MGRLLLGASAVLAVPALETGGAAATSEPALIEVEVTSPPPPAPIHSTDVVVLTARTSEDVLANPSVEGESILLVLEESFEILWLIETRPSDLIVPQATVPQILVSLVATEEVGRLAPGAYQVFVGWEHVLDSGLPPDTDSPHGMGEFTFTVVPEPIGAPFAAMGALALLALTRRRRGRV